MSHGVCEIWTRDGSRRIGFASYSNTSDGLTPGIVDSVDDVGTSTGGWDARAGCHHGELVDAWAYVDCDFHWPVTVCERCGVVTGRLSPWLPDRGYHIPTAEERRADHAWSAEGWPRSGPPPAVLDVSTRHDA
jgi:hypothetical protein